MHRDSARAVVVVLAVLAGSVSAPGARAGEVPLAPVPPAPRELEVSFAGFQGFVLQGTLSLPAPLPTGGAPAALLLPGSGPTDRNGNPPGVAIDLLKQMAERLTGQGFAVLRFDTDDEAVELANRTPYGLSAAVFCNDPARAEALDARLEAGPISIDDAALTALIHEGEKQAFKASGLGGSRMGSASIFRFLRAQARLRNAARAWDPWWYSPMP